jgi:hypothetical protein
MLQEYSDESFQGSGACYTTPIIQFFQDGRFRVKINPQLESATQPKAQGLLHMECDFAIALLYNLNFKKMSWTTF